jgi:hypothetical protein
MRGGGDTFGLNINDRSEGFIAGRTSGAKGNGKKSGLSFASLL